MKTHRICGFCGKPVRKETQLDYPYYCPTCDENRYRFETVHKRDIPPRKPKNRL